MSTGAGGHHRGPASTGWEVTAGGTFVGALVVLLLASVGGVVGERYVPNWLVAALSAAGSVLGAISGIEAFVGGSTFAFSIPSLVPDFGTSLVITHLGGLFLIPTGAVGAASSIYLAAYSKAEHLGRTVAVTLPIFLVAMLLVPVAGSVVTFMLVWEVMALSSTVLVATYHRRSERVPSATLWYIAMTQAGAALILMSFLIISFGTGSTEFASMAARAGRIPGWERSVAFLLALVGFASKSGAVPFHVWLPRAHPEAPAPASALMSGAMVNMGLLGIVLVGFSLLHGGEEWWWFAVMAIGAVSASYGAIFAATAIDLKRLLAYSTSDNIGLMLIGIGASGVFLHQRLGAAAVLSMSAALALMVNHSIIKGSLFLAAGSVQAGTGSSDLNELGGLMRSMPVTGVVFLIGALSISALPPFGGFASEWLLLQGLLQGFRGSSVGIVVAVPLAVAAFALTGGLTAAAFVKGVGVGFLGQARSDPARRATEVGTSMVIGSSLLAFGCLGLGLGIAWVIRPVERVASSLVGLTSGRLGDLAQGATLRAAGTELPTILLFVLLVVSVSFILLVLQRKGRARVLEAWGSGGMDRTARMEYTATAFAEPLLRVFGDVVQPVSDITIDHREESRYYAAPATFTLRLDDSLERSLYRPLIAGLRMVGDAGRRLQNGSINRYLTFGFVALIVALAILS